MQTGLWAFQCFFWQSWEVSAACQRVRRRVLTDLVAIPATLALVALECLLPISDSILPHWKQLEQEISIILRDLPESNRST
jgi:hypothetical protein